MPVRHTLATSPEETQRLRDLFLEVARVERDSKGADENVSLSMALGQRLGVDPAWSASYINVYTVLGGAAVTLHWSPEDVLERPQDFRQWLEDNKPGVPIRRQRRVVWNRDKLVVTQQALARFIDRARELRDAPYDVLWDAVQNEILYFGRYATIKYLEALRRGGVVHAKVPGIMPRGAWSTRLALSHLYPEYDEILNRGGDNPRALQVANECAMRARDMLRVKYGEEYDYFLVETWLCNFQRATNRKGRYPGASHDEELKWYRKGADHWLSSAATPSHLQIPFYEMRRELYPPETLGELQGWDGARDELRTLPRQFGYVWDDLVYDYRATTDLANPVRRT